MKNELNRNIPGCIVDANSLSLCCQWLWQVDRVGTGGALAGTGEGSLQSLLLCHQWTMTAVMRVGMVSGALSLRNKKHMWCSH